MPRSLPVTVLPYQSIMLHRRNKLELDNPLSPLTGFHQRERV